MAFDLFSSLVFIGGFIPDLLDWSHRMFSILLCVKEGDGESLKNRDMEGKAQS